MWMERVGDAEMSHRVYVDAAGRGGAGFAMRVRWGRLVWWDRANVAEKTGVVSGNTYFLRCREDADVEGSETFGRPHAWSVSSFADLEDLGGTVV